MESHLDQARNDSASRNKPCTDDQPPKGFGQWSVGSSCRTLQVASHHITEHTAVTANYHDLFMEALNNRRTGQLLVGFDLNELTGKNAYVVTAQAEGHVVGGLHCYVAQGRLLWFSGLIVDERFRGAGIAPAMIATALTHPGLAQQDLTPIAKIRVFENGEENAASRRAFERIGFVAADHAERAYLSGDWRDEHRLSACSHDAQGRAYTLCRKLLGGADVCDAAHHYLLNWTLRASLQREPRAAATAAE
jgi:GNAT superfamily N-acetyltransferase